MNDPAFHKSAEFATESKEYRTLNDKLAKFKELEKLRKELKHLEELALSEDQEIFAMAKQEKLELLNRLQPMEMELIRSFTPRDPNDSKNVILEIRAGTGGEEAALFAQDLARMYMMYAKDRGFRCENINLNPTGRGGYKEAIFLIESADGGNEEIGAYGTFKFESGVHRVQRVPLTEASGRIHTSAVTVAVLLEAEEVDVLIKQEDLRIDTYRASGHGGQHLQKTDSAVRITHLPTGIVVQRQDERSQLKNREKAMKFLRAKLFELARQEQECKIASNRKKQVGSGDRSEKIRTYNFPQDRITDHRIGLNVHNIQDVLNGNIGFMIQALQSEDDKNRLLE